MVMFCMAFRCCAVVGVHLAMYMYNYITPFPGVHVQWSEEVESEIIT